MKAKAMSTTPVIALFMIISVTGIFLLFHIGNNSLKAVHEWLGFAFVLFGALHAGANWPLTKRYFGGMRGAAIGLMLAAALGYSVLSSSADRGRTDTTLFARVMRAPLSTVALLYGQEAHSLAAQLQEKGYTVASVDSSLEDIASQNNTKPFAIMSAVSNEGHQ